MLCAVTVCKATGVVDYIVDCSACYSLAVQNIKSYSCKVRCDIEKGEIVNHKCKMLLDKCLMGIVVRDKRLHVDCSACYSLAVQNIKSYSCKVRCDVQKGKIVNH